MDAKISAMDTKLSAEVLSTASQLMRGDLNMCDVIERMIKSEKELDTLSTRFTALIQQNNTLAAENERLSEKLSVMENQEPVAYVESVDRLGYPDRLGYQERINGLHADRKFSIGDHLYSKPVPADKPAARITEQDAREIAHSALSFWRNTVNLTLDVWLKDHATTLLNKLNADRCPSHESEQGGAV